MGHKLIFFFLFYPILSWGLFQGSKKTPPHQERSDLVKSSYSSSQIHSRHWYEMPQSSSDKNFLLIYDLFVISFNGKTRFPDWIAYELSPSIVWGFLNENRKWIRGPFLPFPLSLSAKDYKGASQFGYDKGHLAPKGSFKGSVFAYQTQYLTNLVPQKRSLNQGVWRILEEKVRKFVLKGHSVKVLSGPLYGQSAQGKNYERPLPPWPQAIGQLEQVPSGFWKIIAFKTKKALKLCSFIMSQNISKKRSLKSQRVKKQEVEKYSGLLLFRNQTLKEKCDFLL